MVEVLISETSIDNSGISDVTKDIQKLIEEVATSEGKLIIDKGTYLVSSIYLRSNMILEIRNDASICGIADDNKYCPQDTRIAGINMKGYMGIINIVDCHNVALIGEGQVIGAGNYWWYKYWGIDKQGGYRKNYDDKGLRWVVDYDCMRPRNLVIQNSNNIILEGITVTNSGFWNIHVLYSNNIEISNIKICTDEEEGPSTDGIDIDSSQNVVIDNCVISCHDDNICIKSGRDLDGYQTNKPTRNVKITNCKLLKGMGLTFGSEVSGGIEDVTVSNIVFEGTDCGIRIKSSAPRRGFIKNIDISNIKIFDVKYAFNFNLDWHVEYNQCEFVLNDGQLIPEHWKMLLANIPANIPKTVVDNINITNVLIDSKDNNIGRAFQIDGYADQLIKNIKINNLEARVKEFGEINYVEAISFDQSNFKITGKNKMGNEKFDNR